MLNPLIKDFKIALNSLDSIIKENSQQEKNKETTQDFSRCKKSSNPTQIYGLQQETGLNLITAG